MGAPPAFQTVKRALVNHTRAVYTVPVHSGLLSGPDHKEPTSERTKLFKGGMKRRGKKLKKKKKKRHYFNAEDEDDVCLFL